MKNKQIENIALLTIFVSVFLLAGSNGLKKNWVNWRILQAVFSESSEKQANILDWAIQQNSLDCRQNWLLTQIPGHKNDPKKYLKILNCSIEYLDLVSFQQPLDISLAQHAVSLYPLNPRAWFWLAEAQSAAHSPEAVDSYQQVVKLDEHNNLAWCRLGYLYEFSDQIELARDSYLQCCYNGDRGSNGCYGAGRMMEKLGNIPKAIEYYRFSRWAPSRNRADELENK